MANHPGFKAVQASIAAKEGVSPKAAGAILASSTRKASAKAKRKNPRLKRVKMAKRAADGDSMAHETAEKKMPASFRPATGRDRSDM